MRAITAAVVALGVFVAATPTLRAGQEEQFTPEFKALHKTYDAKHTPKLTAPDSVKRGQWFDVTISVGAGGEHPSLAEHHVRYVALYKDTAEIARVYLHPVFSAPKVVFTIALDESGTLRALAEPTHSAAWEASKRISVTP
ncbi:MAG TPA: desulfoferrodoxin family protein [Methylomirabilota bacterium]|jgi:superoxide reductase|nr:desulfoferrodoxin family protein [Methylomirabilota bacterium]HEX6026774.1 desulfoferrodoxin family protein [Solirubrobacter sp.]